MPPGRKFAEVACMDARLDLTHRCPSECAGPEFAYVVRTGQVHEVV